MLCCGAAGVFDFLLSQCFLVANGSAVTIFSASAPAQIVQADLKKWVFEISLSVRRLHPKFEGEKVINLSAQAIKV